MQADLDCSPLVSVVDAPNETLVLEARSHGLCRGMDAPLVRGIELQDRSFVDESCHGLFEHPFGSERPDGGSLSLELDLRGGIEEGLGGHVAEAMSALEVERVDAGDVVDEEDASSFGVSRMCPYASWRVNMYDSLPRIRRISSSWIAPS